MTEFATDEEKWAFIRKLSLSEALRDIAVMHPELGMSSHEISAGFRNRYGQPFSNYTWHMKNSKWSSILADLQSHGDIEQILKDYYFFSAEFFSMCFRDKTGKTLEDYLGDNFKTKIKVNAGEANHNTEYLKEKRAKYSQGQKRKYRDALNFVETEIGYCVFKDSERNLAIKYARAIANLSDSGMGSPKITSKIARMQLRGIVERSSFVEELFPGRYLTKEEEIFLRSIEWKIVRDFLSRTRMEF